MSTGAYSKKRIKHELTEKLARYFGAAQDEATKEQIYKAVVLTVKDILAKQRAEYKEIVRHEKPKQVYYLCMEFLLGRSLKNHLNNLALESAYREVLAEMEVDLEDIYQMEPDPGLGNGGLGRLAACYMDALTTLDYPATGFSLCYEYGLFKQKIIDGNQAELPDVWMPYGDVWLVPRADKVCFVRFGGRVSERWENGQCHITHTEYDEVQAVPYDMYISGYDCKTVNRLRLWRAHNSTSFNMNLFSQGQYLQALQKNTDAEVISKVLYPSDDHHEGKLLRLSQQYFLVSASLQNIISEHLSQYGTLSNFQEKVAVHVNDTHPALCIPELMRILMDIYSYSWERAWSVVTQIVSYTNHTVLPEALESWNVDLFRVKLPRIYSIVEEINRRLCADLWKMYPGDWERISRMSVLGYGQVRMANLCVAASHTVNGVSELHSDILKKTVFSEYYTAMPHKFTNVTNGIAHRRWLCWSNPGLCALLDDTIGSGYRKDPIRLAELRSFVENDGVLAQLREIKEENKKRFADILQRKQGISVSPDTIFDVQVKRMHEYKRQLLNALRIIAYMNELRDNPRADIIPTTFFFGGKAAPGYYMAKEIIKLIWNLGEEIQRDPRVRDTIRVVYLEDYNVSTAECLMPASEISEQISLAGKEASGTGCMKFMINGALTIGTMDGANVEMAQAVGDDNIYIFGLRANEVDELWKNGYTSLNYYRDNQRLRTVMDTLNRGLNGTSFSNIVGYLLYAQGVSDPYMCLADFDSYFSVSGKMRRTYTDPRSWARKSLINIAGAGYFAADRSIHDYSEKIWGIKAVT